MKKDGNTEVLMEDALILKVEGSKIKLIGILGDVKEVDGRIKEVNLSDHRILIEEV